MTCLWRGKGEGGFPSLPLSDSPPEQALLSTSTHAELWLKIWDLQSRAHLQFPMVQESPNVLPWNPCAGFCKIPGAYNLHCKRRTAGTCVRPPPGAPGLKGNATTATKLPLLTILDSASPAPRRPDNRAERTCNSPSNLACVYIP